MKSKVTNRDRVSVVAGHPLEAGEVSPAHLIEFWGLLPVERESASIDRKILDLSRG